jgi:hypothetical protein
MNVRTSATLALATTLALTAGCKKTADNTSNYKTAINNYLATNQSCLWPTPQKFPAQVNTDSDKTAGFDALYNQGLLVRKTEEKKKLLGLVDKQVTDYDLSDKGKSSWTASQTDPSTGNFCYGHREVSSIDTATATGDQPGATASVAYHYDFSSVPGWAKDGGVQNAFPNVQRNLAGGSATATLRDTQNGWVVEAPKAGTSNADGSIVQ